MKPDLDTTAQRKLPKFGGATKKVILQGPVQLNTMCVWARNRPIPRSLRRRIELCRLNGGGLSQERTFLRIKKQGKIQGISSFLNRCERRNSVTVEDLLAIGSLENLAKKGINREILVRQLRIYYEEPSPGGQAPLIASGICFLFRAMRRRAGGANLPGSPVIAADDPGEDATIFMVWIAKWSDGTPAPLD